MENKAKVSIVFLIFSFIGILLATQDFASCVNYDENLGKPLFTLGGISFYAPLFFVWWYKFYHDAPHVFWGSVTYFIGSILVGTFACILLWKYLEKRLTSHGTARWATEREVRETSLLDGKGVILGKTEEGVYLKHNGPHHCIMIAPTRSGKGVGVIIPTLLTWPDSVIITDIKSENWHLTSGYRKKALHNIVLKFDPTSSDGSSVKFNPLEEIRIKTLNEVRDVQNIADMLVDPQGTGQLDHWAKTGHALLVGVILHLKYTLPSPCFADITSFLSNPSKSFEDTLNEMIVTPHTQTLDLFKELYGVESLTHPKVAEAARELLNKSENECSGVLSTAMSFLGLYRDPIVAKNTSTSEFKIHDLMNHEKPVSLYLVDPPSDINRIKPLFRMLLNQFLSRLTEKMEFEDGQQKKGYKHRLLLMIDEFPALGRLDNLESSLAFIAGYGIKAFLIVQGLNQLNKIYTENNSIIDNCHIRIVHTPNDKLTPKYVSDMLGAETIFVKSRTYAPLTIMNKSYSRQEVKRELMTPDEVSRMSPDDEIIFVAGYPPIMAKKIRYYLDDNFKPRVKIAPPERSDTLLAKSNIENTVNKGSITSSSYEMGKIGDRSAKKESNEDIFFDDEDSNFLN